MKKFLVAFFTFILCRGANALPTGYTQLEYIESTGTQYIDLGQRIGSGENITARFAYTSSSKKIGLVQPMALIGEVLCFYFHIFLLIQRHL